MKKAYKLFKVKKKHPGKLFTLYVLTDEPVEMNKILFAKEGPRTPSGKVKSKNGELAFRPGWHLSEIPLATHIGIKENGVIKYMHDDEVWCECEYVDNRDYQSVADERGTINGKLNKKLAYLDHVPVDGYYRYKTSPNMLGEWIIADQIVVKRILSDQEVQEICNKAGYEAMPRRQKYIHN